MIISPLLIIYLLMCIVFNQFSMFIIIVSTIMLHELGHIMVIKLFKGHIRKVKFSIVGGVIDVELKMNIYTKKYYLSNILIAVGRNRNELLNNFCCKAI